MLRSLLDAMTLEEEKIAKASEEKARMTQVERGEAVLSSGENVRAIYERAVTSLQQSDKSKAGIEGIAKPKLNEEERSKRQRQDSENRRVLREFKRAEATGRISNWLKRYAAKKDAEFNAQNASTQQSEKPSATITYFPPSSKSETRPSENTTTPPETNLATDTTTAEQQQTLHPWAIYLSANQASVKIELNSNVYKSTGTFETYDVAGLDTFTSIQMGYVILEASISSGTVDGISVKWGDDGTSERSEWDGDNNQTKCRIRIGYIYQDANNNWVIRQDVFGQLTLVNTCSDSKSTYCFFQT